VNQPGFVLVLNELEKASIKRNDSLIKFLKFGLRNPIHENKL